MYIVHSYIKHRVLSDGLFFRIQYSCCVGSLFLNSAAVTKNYYVRKQLPSITASNYKIESRTGNLEKIKCLFNKRTAICNNQYDSQLENTNPHEKSCKIKNIGYQTAKLNCIYYLVRLIKGNGWDRKQSRIRFYFSERHDFFHTCTHVLNYRLIYEPWFRPGNPSRRGEGTDWPGPPSDASWPRYRHRNVIYIYKLNGYTVAEGNWEMGHYTNRFHARIFQP